MSAVLIAAQLAGQSDLELNVALDNVELLVVLVEQLVVTTGLECWQRHLNVGGMHAVRTNASQMCQDPWPQANTVSRAQINS